jgi:hypothetical protein
MNDNNNKETSHLDIYYREYSLLLQELLEKPTETARLSRECNDLLDYMSTLCNTTTEEECEWMQRIQLWKLQLRHVVDEVDRTNLLKDRTPPAWSQQNESVLNRQNETLERARRSLQDTEELGYNISQTLSENRDKLMSTKQNIDQFSTLTTQAKGLVKSITKPWYQRR